MTPLGILVFLYLTLKLKQKDFIMNFMMLIIILFLTWSAIEMPEIVAKMTLMSKTTQWRVRVAIDFAQMILLFRGIALIKISELKNFRILGAILTSIMSIFAIY